MKRGTDTARTDGTLGTPSQGEPIYTTDTKALFIGDGSTAGGIPATVPASVLQLVNTSSQDINAAATNLVEWSTAIPSWGVDFTFDASTDDTKVTINTAGTYAISCTVAYSTAGFRYNGMLDTIVNGSAAVGPRSSCGYVRNETGHNNGSLHVPFYLYPFAAGAYIQMQVTRETTVTVAANTDAQRSVLTLMRIK